MNFNNSHERQHCTQLWMEKNPNPVYVYIKHIDYIKREVSGVILVLCLLKQLIINEIFSLLADVI